MYPLSLTAQLPSSYPITGRRFGFVTAMHQSVHRSSGCYVGIRTLAKGATLLGHHVETISPALRSGNFLAERYFFNQSLKLKQNWNCDCIVGFDLDGFALPRGRRIPHIANIKGVLADALPYERGLTRAAMALQARWEAEHARRADLVITISEYSRQRLRELYKITGLIAVVPEMIDLALWQQLLSDCPRSLEHRDEFTVLCVCRFYPRKRVALLLRAAHMLHTQIPGLRVRIVGGGPELPNLLRLWHELQLESVVTWVGEAPLHALAREYNRADLFCLPSIQEGFGIVFLEAMAAGKPIVACRAAAIPEVVRHGSLVDPESAEALAHGIWQQWKHPDPQVRQQKLLDEYDMLRVSAQFLQTVEDCFGPERAYS